MSDQKFSALQDKYKDIRKRYVNPITMWEDVQEILKMCLDGKEIVQRLEAKLADEYSNGYDEGYKDGLVDGRKGF